MPLWDDPAIRVFPKHTEVSRQPALVEELLRQGHELFVTRFNALDGVGRPTATGDSKPTIRLRKNDSTFNRVAGPDANSCVGCHNQPSTGGAGGFAANVFVGAHFTDPPTHSIHNSRTNERNTIGMFGSGAVEILALEMTRDLAKLRDDAIEEARDSGNSVEVPMKTKGVSFGKIVVRPDATYDIAALEGVDEDLVVKPFGVKGVAISLREFTINALNQHHGIQAVERFGWERTGKRDFDEDGVETEFSVGQTSALVLFQASLPAPGAARDQLSDDMAAGRAVFHQVGCAECHIPALPLRTKIFREPNPFNRPGNLLPSDALGEIALELPLSNGLSVADDGTIWIHPFTDLKRHNLCDDEDSFFCNEQIRQDNVPTELFLTAKLWDAGSSAPYGHRGDCMTLSEAIHHHAGDAAGSRDGFLALPDVDKRQVLRFLAALRAEPHFVQRGQDK